MKDEISLAQPKKVSTAITISYVAYGIGLINSFILLLGLESTTQQKIKPIIIFILSQALQFFLIKQMNAGQKWARTISLVFFILGGISMSLTIVDFLEADLIIGLISIFIGVLQLLVLILLYSKEGNAWFNLKKSSIS